MFQKLYRPEVRPPFHLSKQLVQSINSKFTTVAHRMIQTITLKGIKCFRITQTSKRSFQGRAHRRKFLIVPSLISFPSGPDRSQMARIGLADAIAGISLLGIKEAPEPDFSVITKTSVRPKLWRSRLHRGTRQIQTEDCHNVKPSCGPFRSRPITMNNKLKINCCSSKQSTKLDKSLLLPNVSSVE